MISTISAYCNVDFDDAILKERVSFSSSVYDNLLYCAPISVNFLVTVSISEEDLSKARFEKSLLEILNFNLPSKMPVEISICEELSEFIPTWSFISLTSFINLSMLLTKVLFPRFKTVTLAWLPFIIVSSEFFVISIY